jgi:AcrR family transcriptional regulator
MGTRIDGRTLRYQHRRGELIEAVGEYVLENGVASLSLRRVADAVGISHVTLQHHFGSKEDLIGEVVEHLLERTFTPQDVYTNGSPAAGTDLATRLRALWALVTSPAGQRDIRLFVEILAQGALGRTEPSEAVERSIAHRLDMITMNLVSLGCPEVEARPYATLTLSIFRGMVLDLLATGERERLDEAFELMLANAERRAAGWHSSPQSSALVEKLGALPIEGPPGLKTTSAQ